MRAAHGASVLAGVHDVGAIREGFLFRRDLFPTEVLLKALSRDCVISKDRSPSPCAARTFDPHMLPNTHGLRLQRLGQGKVDDDRCTASGSLPPASGNQF